MTTIITLVYLIIILALAIGAYKWLKNLAAEDKFSVCYVPTNEVVGIRRGGAFHRFLFDPTGGTHLNDPRSWQYFDKIRPWERIPNCWNDDPKLAGKMHPEFEHVDERNWFTRLTGIYFFLPFVEEVDRYPFEWDTYTGTKVSADGKTKTHEFRPHPGENVRSIYAKVVQYYGQVMVLTQDGIEVLVNFTFDVDLTNPFVARFTRGNFLGQVKSRLEAELRNYIGSETFSQLFSETDSGTPAAGTTPTAGGRGKFYENYVRRLNASIDTAPCVAGPGIEELYGVSIKAFHILDIQDPTGRSTRQVEARQELEIAKKGVQIAAELADAKAITGGGTRRHDEEVNAARVKLERELMEIRTSDKGAVSIAKAEVLFRNARVVSIGDGGIKALISLSDLDDPPTGTATAPTSATIPPAARPVSTVATATPARAGRTGP